jgi:RNA polymerase sigma-70 factor, ECF subfamily
VDWVNEGRRFVAFEGEERTVESLDRDTADWTDTEFRQGLFAYATKVIEEMPPEDREALTLTELDGLSREELADQLGISISAAKSRVVRARARLRKAVEDCCRLTIDPYGKVIGWQRRAECCRGRS